MSKIIYSTQQFKKAAEFLNSKEPNKNMSELLSNTIKEFVRSGQPMMATLGFFLLKEEEDDDAIYVQIYIDPAFGSIDLSFTEDNYYQNRQLN